VPESFDGTDKRKPRQLLFERHLAVTVKDSETVAGEIRVHFALRDTRRQKQAFGNEKLLQALARSATGPVSVGNQQYLLLLRGVTGSSRTCIGTPLILRENTFARAAGASILTYGSVGFANVSGSDQPPWPCAAGKFAVHSNGACETIGQSRVFSSALTSSSSSLALM